jgi:hypothetical protein
MQILGHATAGANPAFRMGLDMSNVVTRVATVKEARALPRGSVVGDLHGGLTFGDSVAAALEARSSGGWQEVRTAPGGECWTVIVVDH